MPTVQLPPPQLKRNEHNHRRRRNRGTSNNSSGTPSPKISKRVSSIHSSPPPISDRESSLYSHRVYASPAHDWSKSCNDLGVASILARLDSPAGLGLGLEFSSFSVNNNNYDDGGARLKAESFNGNVYGISSPYSSRSVACLQDTTTTPWVQSPTSPSTSTARGSRKYHSVIDVDFAISESESDDHLDSTELEHTVFGSTGSSTARNSFDLPTKAYYQQTRFEQDTTKREKGKKWYRSIWVKDFGPFGIRNKKTKYTMSGSTTPVIPPRSALRSVPAPKSASPRPDAEFHDVPLGPVLFKTPSLSSGSDGDVFDDATTNIPAGTAYRTPTSPNTEEKEKGFFGRKKLAVERDPMRVRDGREAKESHTGVYTPPTFPGACGPRPSHFPSHVYTPQNFQLYPSTTETAGPSRSSSTSSTTTGESDTPTTPLSPTFRVFGNKTMAGLRRISGQIASYSPTTPNSRDRESYFSYSSTSSRQSSLGPLTPQSAMFPSGAGLGVGLTEKDGVTLASFPMPPPDGRARTMSTYGVDGSPAIKRVVEAPTTKRKPVPEVVADGSDDDDVERHRRSVHAL